MDNIVSESFRHRMEILADINKHNRTSTSLIKQGYPPASVQRGLSALITQKLIYRHGKQKNAYYSINPCASDDAVDPIELPSGVGSSVGLALRMGYTALVPLKGRVIKGL